jgi:hypothetical protein
LGGSRQHPPPERREYPHSPTVLVADPDRIHQEIAGKAVRDDADLLQRHGDLIGDGLMRRLRNLIPEHRGGAGVARQGLDDLGRGPPAQQQRGACRGQACLQAS